MGSEHLGRVRRPTTDLLPSAVIQRLRANLGIPQNFQALALGVVGNARKSDGGQVRAFRVRSLDQPPAASEFDEITDLWHGLLDRLFFFGIESD